jgi:LysR family transcriptional activator of nhaA
MRLNYKHLHYFWRVARTGGVLQAARELHLTPQTVSGQLHQFADVLGVELFEKSGRGLQITEAGQLALRYADEIFALGAELESALRDAPTAKPLDFRVGLSDAVPKSIARHLLEPALAAGPRIIVREGKMDTLLGELALHRLDAVISDRPMPPGLSVRAYSHRLGSSGMRFFASHSLKRNMPGDFPGCLHDQPFLLPGNDAAVRAPLEAWLRDSGVRVRVSGEFDDTALMKAFGEYGHGAFAGPAVLATEIESQYHLRSLGDAPIRYEFFAISVERRIKHPCVVAMTQSAREAFFAESPATAASRRRASLKGGGKGTAKAE